MSKVTALVSAYYAADWLDARILNLFGTKVDAEIIIVCQEGSAEDQIASGYNLKVIRTPDIPTIGKAWNMAIREATGDYLTTANTDDFYHIGGLKRMASELDERPEIDLVFAQVDIDDGNMVAPWRRIENTTGEVKDITKVLQKRCIVGPMPLWRRSVHGAIGYFKEDYTVASDYEFWLRMARGGHRFYYVAESLGVYVKRSDSLEHRNVELCRSESRMVQA